MDFLWNRSALKWGRWQRDVISFSVADMDFPPPPEIREGVMRALLEDRTPYGGHAGDPDVLEVICEKLNRVNHIPAEPDDVYMIPGSKFAIFVVCYFALKPGDECIISPAPIYPPFIKSILNAGAIPVFNSVDYSNGCRFDEDDLRARITPRTKLLMVCNPHNPCGRVFTREELEAIGKIACEHDLLIFSDELYEDMVIEGDHISMASLSDEISQRTLSVFGFSKAFGIPGFRIAYVVSKGPFMKDLHDRISDIIVHTDTLAQAAAKAALTSGGPWLEALREHLRKTRDYGIERLHKMPGITCFTPEATPFLFPNISSFGLSSQEMTDYLLKEARIVVQSGASFGPPGEGYVRINFATALPVLEEGFDRMEKALKKLA